MDIDEDLVKSVAKTARLELTSEEIKMFSVDFQQVLSAFSDISEVKTEGIKKALHPLDIKNKLREDVSSEKNGLANLRLTKHKKNNYYEGPGL